jgi:hypothetical protein
VESSPEISDKNEQQQSQEAKNGPFFDTMRVEGLKLGCFVKDSTCFLNLMVGELNISFDEL